MQIGEMSWTDFEEERLEIALLPVGSTEQHGPHGPLSTDSLIAEEIAERAAEKTGALQLPPVKVGVSREHSRFPGTLHVSPETFRQQLSEIVLSASKSGPKKFVIVNGHGGNIPHIREICEDLYYDQDLLVLEWTWFNAVSAKGMGHAGKLETSLVLYLREELIGETSGKGANSWGKRSHGARVDYDTSLFTENGVVGDPSQATREKGKELFQQSVRELSNLIIDLKDPSSNPFE